jgi:hypothetical protein
VNKQQCCQVAASLPGLTRQSIILAKKMDPRVKPAGDPVAAETSARRRFDALCETDRRGRI